MRFCQAQALIHSLLQDKTFQKVDFLEKEYVCHKILDEIRGRMLEEIVLIETKKLLGAAYHVCKYQFLGGEYDMIIYDKKANTCKIYEIKHSKEAVENQCRHLLNSESCHTLEEHFGPITGKYVLYRGEDTVANWGIEYRNVAEFLKGLPMIR